MILRLFVRKKRRTLLSLELFLPPKGHLLFPKSGKKKQSVFRKSIENEGRLKSGQNRGHGGSFWHSVRPLPAIDDAFHATAPSPPLPRLPAAQTTFSGRLPAVAPKAGGVGRLARLENIALMLGACRVSAKRRIRIATPYGPATLEAVGPQYSHSIFVLIC